MKTGGDMGYSHTKGATQKGVFRFPSIVGEIEQASYTMTREEQGADDIVITTDSGTWAVGEAALTTRIPSRPESRAWIHSQEYGVLFQAALAQMTAGSFTDMKIVTGLPVTFIEDRDELASILQREWRFQLSGRDRQVVRVSRAEAIPQPFGTLCDCAMDNHGRIINHDLANGLAGIIDVGGKTTGFLTVKDLREIPAETGSINIGAWKAMALAQSAINQQFPGVELEDHEVAAAVAGDGVVNYFGEPQDVSEIIAKALAPLARRVIAEATQRWDTGARLDGIFITGGGAWLVGQAICEHYRHAKIIKAPAFANARGFYKMAVRSF